ncbi:peptide/nickel transport system substrate-binding protein [Diaminobutyricimonas aerilata]|uniref:Peptide/nickel transport system substrate-binding protein n=1 Tax=Diaminobutyricimonas aerilata TaxID=1162967 RepID=A0A2M9CLW1_9MICO|nr:ABC transporter substrate-binding protein [Diaminobutyricimonas aerilata]PJJ72880.1 peptide/nickel transport system substrate-binding protein [Diaminobutyricimonas aerilata]
MTSRRRWRIGIAATAVVSIAALAGCTGTEGQKGGLTEDGLISSLQYGDFGGGTNPQSNFNPFLEATRLAAWDYVYEPLMFVNGYSCEAQPWLATEYEWVDPQTLTFTLRDGVEFTDGEPLTAADVAFTFNLIKENPALDTQGVWRYLSAVEATDDATVTFSFTEPGASAFTLINNVRVVPEHIWSEVDDPVTFTNDEPVGTGPMTVKSFNPQQLVIERNEDYWQADKVKVQEIVFSKADGGGQVEQLKLARGDYDTNAMFIPNIDEAYVQKDPENNHYWFPSASPISLFMNLEQKPFDDVEFRRAMAHAIDRDTIIEQAQFGYVEPASQTNLVLPAQEDFLPEELQGDATYVPFDLEEADRILTEAGYELGADGTRIDPSGQPMEYTFKVPGGWNDWVQAAEIIRDNLGELGITLDVQTPTPESMEQDRKLGQYEMLFGVRGGSCNMFRNYQEPLASDQTAPTGQEAATNEIRWRDPETDALLEQLRVAVDEEGQKEAIAGLAQIMMDEVPFVPIWYGANWFEYSTRNAEGWPNEDDPFARPTDNLLILTNLQPAGQD